VGVLQEAYVRPHARCGCGLSKWASVGVAKGDEAADVGVVAEARSAVVRKAGTKGHLRYLQAAPKAVALFSATLRDSVAIMARTFASKGQSAVGEETSRHVVGEIP
jgi:hypothetical protein